MCLSSLDVRHSLSMGYWKQVTRVEDPVLFQPDAQTLVVDLQLSPEVKASLGHRGLTRRVFLESAFLWCTVFLTTWMHWHSIRCNSRLDACNQGASWQLSQHQCIQVVTRFLRASALKKNSMVPALWSYRNCWLSFDAHLYIKGCIPFFKREEMADYKNYIFEFLSSGSTSSSGKGSCCSIAEECTPGNRPVAGLIPAGRWALFLLLSWLLCP